MLSGSLPLSSGDIEALCTHESPFFFHSPFFGILAKERGVINS